MNYTIAYFKLDAHGVRKRRKLVLDLDRNWVSDEEAPLVAASDSPTPRSSNAQESALQHDGVQYERLSASALLITHIPQQQSDVMAMFSEGAECPEPLRALKSAYFADLAALSSDPTCPSLDCAQARLIRDYKQRAEQLLGVGRV
jgi:hypothetical protein